MEPIATPSTVYVPVLDPFDFIRTRAANPEAKLIFGFDHTIWEGLWRASAMEAVKQSDEFPAALLTLPEGIDGSLGHGEATEIDIRIIWDTETKTTLTITDNGKGFKDTARFKAWAAQKSTTSNMHRNGHGLKKMLSKLMPEYKQAEWGIKYCHRGGSVFSITAPYLGEKTPVQILEDNTQFKQSGTEVWAKVNSSVFKPFDTPVELFNAVKQIIRTRYAESVFLRTKFTLTVQGQNSQKITESSESWHSFRRCVERETSAGRAVCVSDAVMDLENGVIARIAHQQLAENEKKNKKIARRFVDEFPKQGKKGMDCSRAHIALGERIIECIPLHRLVGVKSHNSYNGHIFFVDFGSEDLNKLPRPATTKVGFWEEDECFQIFKAKFAAKFTTKELKDTAAQIKMSS